MTRSPSKFVRSAILSAFAGVISIGISPGTVAIVLSGISPSIGELAGLNGVLTATPDSQPAVHISSAGDNASGGPASGSGVELLLVQAASDVDESPGTGATGVSAGPPSLNEASPLAFGAQSFGSNASVTGILADLPRLGTASRVGAPLAIADEPFIVSENAAPAAPSSIPTDSGPGEPPVNDNNFPSEKEKVVPDSLTPVAFPLPLLENEEAIEIRPAQEVPAPATLLLLLAGMPGLLLLRRRGRPIDDSTG
jgi:hypothetical protein